ncbi:MAG: hypothetical protein AAFX99_28245, partial [Myxococcota bacterium]
THHTQIHVASDGEATEGSGGDDVCSMTPDQNQNELPPEVEPGSGLVTITGGVDLGVVCASGDLVAHMPMLLECNDETDGPTGPDLSVGCGSNVAPVLGNPWFIVDGQPQQTLETLPPDGRLSLLIPYRDMDCNLGCGLSEEQQSNDIFEVHLTRQLDAELSCQSSDAPGTCLSAEVTFDPRVEGEHRFVLQVADRCGVTSTPLELTVYN